MSSVARRVGVVDYGSGNLRSVSKALEAVGASVRLVASPLELNTVDAVVVPGVGAFGDCAKNLRRASLWEPLHEWIRSGRPYLGICLGYQLLFERSEESPDAQGFGIFEGSVRRFSGEGLKVPHMGWNSVQAAEGPLYRSLESPFFYFVHSFFPVPQNPSIVSARCEYGESFAASISSNTLHAVQFHPEKSQSAGLTVLGNFMATLN